MVHLTVELQRACKRHWDTGASAAFVAVRGCPSTALLVREDSVLNAADDLPIEPTRKSVAILHALPVVWLGHRREHFACRAQKRAARGGISVAAHDRVIARLDLG